MTSKGISHGRTNKLYVDPSYLDSSLEKIGSWVGDKVRGARKYDEELKESDSVAKRAVGYASAFILDKVSDANNFIKDKIKTASDFYNDPERKDTWYAKLGRAGTFGADMLTSTFTLPATIVDYKASDKERSGAIVGTLVMAATVGAIRNGGPAWKSLGNGISKGASRIGVNRVAQWIGKTEVGQWMGRSAGKIGEVAVKLEKKFEKTGFAKGMDKVKAGLGKLNPEIKIGGSKVTPGGALEVHPEMPNVMIDSGIPGFNMDKLLKELERTPTGSRIAGRIRNGEIHVIISREQLAEGVEGMALGNELQITWAGSIKETASTAIHEGAHVIDPPTMPGGQNVSEVSREAIAREAEYEYRMKAGLGKSADPIEHAYRDTFETVKKAGASDAEARLAAEQALIKALRADSYYGRGKLRRLASRAEPCRRARAWIRQSTKS